MLTQVKISSKLRGVIWSFLKLTGASAPVAPILMTPLNCILMISELPSTKMNLPISCGGVACFATASCVSGFDVAAVEANGSEAEEGPLSLSSLATTFTNDLLWSSMSSVVA